MFDLQKASMLKRVSAWLLDVILLSVLATGFALLLSAAFGYDNYNDNLQRYYTEYEQLYGIDFNISDEEYLALGEEVGSVMLMHMQSLTMMPMSAGRFLL